MTKEQLGFLILDSERQLYSTAKRFYLVTMTVQMLFRKQL